jgi:hypothetical protein
MYTFKWSKEMKTKEIILSFLFVSIFFLFQCSKHSLEPFEPELANGRVIGSIHGIVTDFSSNARFDVAQIKVTWVIDGKMQSIWTDELGYYIITDLSSGEYDITFSGASNYAISRIHVEIPTLAEIVSCCGPTDKDYPYSVIQDVYLFQKNAIVTGIVYTQQDDQTIELADGVTVVADFHYSDEMNGYYNITPAQYTTTTNSSGVFSFFNLPCTPTINLRTMPYIDNVYSYAVAETTLNLIPDGTLDVGSVVLNIAEDEPFIVSNNFINVENFILTDNLAATFSKAMNTTSFEIQLLKLDESNYSDYFDSDDFDDFDFFDLDSLFLSNIIECDVTWSNNVSLNIDPIVPLEAGVEYRLDINGMSSDSNPFSEEFYFETQEGIEFVSTNLERAQNIYDQFPVGSNIEITFTMPVDLDNIKSQVMLLDSAHSFVYIDISTSSNTLIIDPQDGLEYDQKYYLMFKVYSSIPGDIAQGFFVFQTETAITIPDQVTGFALNESSGWNADWTTTSIDFRWNTVEGAEGYVIFAKDDNNNADLIVVEQFDAYDDLTEQSGNINLPEQFDYFNDDIWQTPFVYGTQVTFRILAYNSAGIGPFSSQIVVYDNTSPTGMLSQSESVNNIASSNTKTVGILFSVSEYLSSDIVYNNYEAGGDTLYTLPVSLFSYEWAVNMKGGVFTVTIPANQNGAGDTFTLNFEDTNGNKQTYNHTLW